MGAYVFSMKRTLFTAKAWRTAGLIALAIACAGFSGCATTSQVTQSSPADSGVDSAYYQSSDNPFHAD